jgi:hypothetical protein
LEINTTLLRERFVIRDTESPEVAPIVAVSNRLALPLHDANGDLTDTFIIRAQNMHSCIRMAAQILNSFVQHGPILQQSKAFDFEEAWKKSGSTYENAHNKNRWGIVYHKGTEIFTSGSPHSFLGIIEKCDSKNPGNYDRSIKMAEEAFHKTGRKIEISYEANIGMVLNVKPDIGRCGLIYRGAERNATFNFTTEPNAERNVSPVHCMNICACFLEGLQLAYSVGIAKDKVKLSIIKKFSPEEKEAEQASHRIGELNLELNIFENRYKLKFRPEKPEFSQAIDDAERFHRKIFDRQEKNIQ